MSFTESLDDLVAANENGLLGIHRTWTRTRLADICSILNGFPFSSEQFIAKGGTPLIRIRDIVRGRTETQFIGEHSAEFIVRHGDLIVGMDGDFNCALWSGAEALLNQRVCKLTVDEQYYDVRLLVHALQGYLSAINSKTSAITVKHLSSRTIAEIPLPLPPRSEQRRLVEAIESYFTRVDAAVATLERVQCNLKRYRASVLNAAVEGRLVPTEAELARTEGRAYEPASRLLARVRAERQRRWEEAELAKMMRKGKNPSDDTWKTKYVEPLRPETGKMPAVPVGWTSTTLEALTCAARTISYGILMPKDHVPDGVPFVKVRDMRSGALSVASLQRTTHAIAARFPRSVLKAGDLLVAIRGTYGRVVDVPLELEGGNITQDSARIDVLPGVNRRYVKWFLLSAPTQSYFKRVARGVAVKGVNIADLRATPILLPPQAEQERIVQEIEDLLSLEHAHEDVIAVSRARLTRLRRSILRWAFEGRLADQDQTDEPAPALLERVKTQRLSARSAPADTAFDNQKPKSIGRRKARKSNE